MSRLLLALPFFLLASGCQAEEKHVQVGLYGFNGKVLFYLNSKKVFERDARTSGFGIYSLSGIEDVNVTGCEDVKIIYQLKKFQSRICFQDLNGVEVYNENQIKVVGTKNIQGRD